MPVWVRFELSLREAGLACEPVPVVDEQGALLPEAHEVLEVVARHQMVLCTGHLSRDEIFALVDAAVGAGIETIVVTHPEFPSQSVAPDDQVELARKGAARAVLTTTHHRQGAVGGHRRALSAEHCGSDLGQNFNPPVEDGLALMADRSRRASARTTCARWPWRTRAVVAGWPEPGDVGLLEARGRLAAGADRLDDVQQMRAHRARRRRSCAATASTDGGVCASDCGPGEDRGTGSARPGSSSVEVSRMAVSLREISSRRRCRRALTSDTLRGPRPSATTSSPQQAASSATSLRRVEQGAAHRQARAPRARRSDCLALGDEGTLAPPRWRSWETSLSCSRTHQRGADRGAAEPKVALSSARQALARLQGTEDGVAQHLVAGWPRRAHVGAILGGVRGRIVANPSANEPLGRYVAGRSRSRVAPASLPPRRSRAARRRSANSSRASATSAIRRRSGGRTGDQALQQRRVGAREDAFRSPRASSPRRAARAARRLPGGGQSPS